MIPGPDLVLACPRCGAPARLFSIFSGNTFGTIAWTDGWRDAPMLPQPPRITRCHACGKIFWTAMAAELASIPAEIAKHLEAGWPHHYASCVVAARAKEIVEANPGLSPDETIQLFEKLVAEEAAKPAPAPSAEWLAAGKWASAPYLEPLDAAGVAEALAAGLGETPDLEMELRVLLWWRGNDAFRREDAPVGYATDPAAIANMERLIEMMADGAEDLLLFRAEAQRELGRFDDARLTLEGVCCSDWWPAKARLLELLDAGSRKLDVLFAAAPEDSADAGSL